MKKKAITNLFALVVNRQKTSRNTFALSLQKTNECSKKLLSVKMVQALQFDFCWPSISQMIRTQHCLILQLVTQFVLLLSYSSKCIITHTGWLSYFTHDPTDVHNNTALLHPLSDCTPRLVAPLFYLC